MATAAVVVALLIFAAAAAIAGVMALVSTGIRREERYFTLTGQAPGRLSRGARLLTGLYVHDVVYADVIERETTLV
jgi:hypothetical protein